MRLFTDSLRVPFLGRQLCGEGLCLRCFVAVYGDPPGRAQCLWSSRLLFASRASSLCGPSRFSLRSLLAASLTRALDWGRSRRSCLPCLLEGLRHSPPAGTSPSFALPRAPSSSLVAPSWVPCTDRRLVLLYLSPLPLGSSSTLSPAGRLFLPLDAFRVTEPASLLRKCLVRMFGHAGVKNNINR